MADSMIEEEYVFDPDDPYWTENDDKTTKKMILTWRKLDVSGGFNPAFREGHSTGSYEDLMILFGGFEAGRRVNSSLILDVRLSRWSHASCVGDLPAPRSLQASCTIGSFYVIHGGETSRDNLMSTKNSPINTKNDICPGDSISIAGSKNKNTGIIDTANLCTLDDMYVLEWEVSSAFKKEGVRVWRKIACQLAPLPRCGHTLTSCNIQGKSSCVLLGGYSRETNTASSSIHLFYTDDFKKVTEGNLNDKESIKNDIKRNSQPYLTWRTLECTGQSSGPRYKHSTTLLSGGSDGSSFLAVFGGIGSSGNVLHDIHLLDLDNLTWSSVSNHNAANKPIGTFFHSAMSIPRIVEEQDNEEKVDGSRGDVLIVFGGSTNVSDSSSNCVPGLRCYDPITSEWSKVKTAYLYPSGRYGQSTTTVDGYSPAHTLPNTGNTGNSTFFPESIGDDDRGHCAVIFGGSNAIMQCAETWILDLKWRPNGVQQFDHTHDKRTEHMVKSQLMETEDVSKYNTINEGLNIDKGKNTYLSKSSSLPTLLKSTNSLGHSLSNPNLDSKLAESAFHKVRRERAQASLLLQRERERAMRAEDREQKLLLEIAALHQQIKDIQESHENESSQLRKELEKSVNKEAKYRALNEEAYTLLLLHGINSINQ